MAILRASAHLLHVPSNDSRTAVVSQLRRTTVLMPWPVLSMRDSRSDCRKKGGGKVCADQDAVMPDVQDAGLLF